MIANREVCLFLTLNCNQNCKYCHRFLGIDDMNFENNKRIINQIAEDGIKNMTFTGGEALIHPNFLELLKLANRKGIKCKLITNGVILANDCKMRECYSYLDSITLSIDSTSNNINEKLGRGSNHADNIKKVLESLKKEKLKVNINTVMTKENLGEIEKLGEFLRKYKINSWRIFKFAPLRETAKKNRKKFEISNVEFRESKPVFISFSNVSKIEFREDDDMESRYVLIMPNGNVVITKNNEDVTIGNILENKISQLLNESIITKTQETNRKIRTIVASDNENQRNDIVNAIKKLNYVEIVGITTNGIDTFNKIIEKEPEMVFTKYCLTDMSGVDMLKKSKEVLSTKMPIFNFIGENLTQEEFKQLTEIEGSRVNAFISEFNKEKTITNILKDYKEFVE